MKQGWALLILIQHVKGFWARSQWKQTRFVESPARLPSTWSLKNLFFESTCPHRAHVVLATIAVVGKLFCSNQATCDRDWSGTIGILLCLRLPKLCGAEVRNYRT